MLIPVSYTHLIEQKLRDYELYKLYTEMELPLAYLLAKMELAGIKPDVKLLESCLLYTS